MVMMSRDARQAAVTMPRCHNPATATVMLLIAASPFLKHPRLALQVLQRADHGVADGEGWRPAERADFFGVEEDERAVADPAALAAGVFAIRVQSEMRGNPAERLVDVAVLVGAEVEHVDQVLALADHRQHRGQAIL